MVLWSSHVTSHSAHYSMFFNISIIKVVAAMMDVDGGEGERWQCGWGWSSGLILILVLILVQVQEPSGRKEEEDDDRDIDDIDILGFKYDVGAMITVAVKGSGDALRPRAVPSPRRKDCMYTVRLTVDNSGAMPPRVRSITVP